MSNRKPSEKPFDPHKPCRLRDGREVDIVTINAKGGYSIHGRIVGSSRLLMWNDRGETSIAPGLSVVRYLDLVNVSEPPMTTERKTENVSDADLTEEQLVNLMRDPRYWKQRDPTILAKVADGFKRLYPDNPAKEG